MPFIPSATYTGHGIKCSIRPTALHCEKAWYCSICNQFFDQRANPPCGEKAVPNEKYDRFLEADLKEDAHV